MLTEKQAHWKMITRELVRMGRKFQALLAEEGQKQILLDELPPEFQEMFQLGRLQPQDYLDTLVYRAIQELGETEYLNTCRETEKLLVN